MIPALVVASLLTFSDMPPPCPPLDRDDQESTGPAADPARQFDFWIGSWECRGADGELAGTNTIRKILGGAVLEEEWRGASGSHGKSLNIHDAATGRWHQTWVDDSGLLLLLDGGLQEDGSMLMEGKRPGEKGGVVRHRIRWRPLDGGRVRQTWDQSKDDGALWTNLVDLVYSPRTQSSEDE